MTMRVKLARGDFTTFAPSGEAVRDGGISWRMKTFYSASNGMTMVQILWGVDDVDKAEDF